MARKVLTAGNDVYYSDLVPTGGETANNITAGRGHDTVTGNNYNDYIWGEDGNDTLHGGGGNDVLSGGNGNNKLYGGVGDDWLYGDGFGTNLFDGGVGNDVYLGGPGVDTFIFRSASSGLDRIDSMQGASGGVDYLQLDIKYADAHFGYADGGASLMICSKAEAADGIISNGIVVEDYFSKPTLGLLERCTFTDGTCEILF